MITSTQTKKNHLSCWLRRWIVDKGQLRIHLLYFLARLSLSYAVFKLEPCLWSIGCPTFYSFSCHRPTKAGAASKQLQNITLLIVEKPRCIFSYTSFTQLIVSFFLDFILYFFFLFIQVWNDIACNSSWSLLTFDWLTLVRIQGLSSFPFSLSLNWLELTGILMPVKYFICLCVWSIC